VLVVAALVSLSVVACGPPAEACQSFSSSTGSPMDTPESAVSITIYERAALFPSGVNPEVVERTDTTAVFRLRKGNDTAGWITVTKGPQGWGQNGITGTTCAVRPTTTGASPPTSR
jgi:hypothetical protein